MLAAHGLLDLLHPVVQVHALALDLGEDLLGLVGLADGDQEAGGLGDREGEQAVEEGGDDHHAEHPLPGLQAADLAALIAVGELEDAVVDQLGDGDADDDGGLLEGAEAAAVGGGGDLGDVGGADDGGHADGEAADDPPEGEVPEGEGQGRADGADGEEDGGDLHAADAADAVGDPAGGGGADGAADQGDGDDLGEGAGADVVPVADRLDGAVDDGAVVAEEETAHRGGGRDEDDVTEVVRVGATAFGGGRRGRLLSAGHMDSWGLRQRCRGMGGEPFQWRTTSRRPPLEGKSNVAETMPSSFEVNTRPLDHQRMRRCLTRSILECGLVRSR